MAKSTNAEKEQRIAKITDLLSNNTQRQDIVQYSKEQWDINQDQADKYIREATKGIKEIAKEFKEFSLENAIKRHNEIQELAREAKQYNVCNDINKDLNKLGGLYKEDNKQKENTIVIELDGEEL